MKEAKEKEIQNLETYETFEEVDDIGQETIGSRWIVTEKQKHDRQKHAYLPERPNSPIDYRAHLTRGIETPTLPSPTPLGLAP